MKKIVILLIAVGISGLISSCGPSKEEVEAREKFVADSIAAVQAAKDAEVAAAEAAAAEAKAAEEAAAAAAAAEQARQDSIAAAEASKKGKKK